MYVLLYGNLLPSVILNLSNVFHETLFKYSTLSDDVQKSRTITIFLRGIVSLCNFKFGNLPSL